MRPLSEAAHSLIDLGATIMSYFAVRISGQPADAEHHYGHGKVESISALIETGCCSCCPPSSSGKPGSGSLAMRKQASSLAIGVGRDRVGDRRRLLPLARGLQSGGPNIESRARSQCPAFRSDMLSSIAVLIGLAGVALGYHWAIRRGRRGCRPDLDSGLAARTTDDETQSTAPRGAAEEITAIAQHVSGVVAVEQVRVRQARRRALCRPHGCGESDCRSSRRRHQRSHRAPDTSDHPKAEVTVNTEPRALSDESVLERVMVSRAIARWRCIMSRSTPLPDVLRLRLTSRLMARSS